MRFIFDLCCGASPETSKKNAVFMDFTNAVVDNDPSWMIQQVEEKITLMQQTAAASSYRRSSRGTIFASPLNLDDIGYEAPPSYEKDDEERAFLQNALQHNFLLADLGTDERDQLIQAMQQEIVDEGHLIIRQGDKGDYYYIVQDGVVEYIDKGNVVGRGYAGDAFGELALLYNCPRAVSCRAASEQVTLWKVDQLTFRRIMASRARNHETQIKEQIRRISLFQKLDPSATTRFVQGLTPAHWTQGSRIVQKGKEGNVFYIIQSGTVLVHDIGLGDSQAEDQILGPGEWFGERALLTGEVRAANVTALEDVSTLAMDRQTFEEVVGPLQNYLEMEMRKKFIKSIPTFATVSDFELDKLAMVMKEVRYTKGTKLTEYGQPCTNNLWIISHGRVLVHKGGTDNLYSLKTGDHFLDQFVSNDGGEQSNNSTHTATCDDDVTTWMLTRRDLLSVMGTADRLGQVSDFRRSQTDNNLELCDLEKHRIIGKGAFGKVWLVHDKRHKGEAYALKVFCKRLLLESNQDKGVLREKELLEILQHPFILHSVSSFQDERNLYLLLPLVCGGELFRVLHKRVPFAKKGLPKESAAFYVACILEALGYFHQRNIAYRDLKLENVLIDADGYCKVVDLGFCKVVNDKTFTLVGTPEYLAPEIILSKGHNKAVDYWALGVLVYELLVGRTPFYVRGSSQMDMFKRIVTAKYEFTSQVDETARDLIVKMLRRNPSKRLGNMSNGYIDVKQHDWFDEADISFPDIIAKEFKAPWKPDCRSPVEATDRNYDDFGEDEIDEDVEPLSPEEQARFAGF